MRSTVAVLFRETKVNDIYEIALLAETHEEVVRLDVPVDEVFRVYVLDATYLV